MALTTTRIAETPADFESARSLCREWADWQLRTLAEYRENILMVFEPKAYAKNH